MSAEEPSASVTYLYGDYTSFVPRKVLVYACFPRIFINSIPFLNFQNVWI